VQNSIESPNKAPAVALKRNRFLAITSRVLVVGLIMTAENLFSQGAPFSLVPLSHETVASLLPGYAPPLSTTFLVTNNTSSTILVSLLAIDVKSGSNWVTQMRPPPLSPWGPLFFSYPGPAPLPGSTNYLAAVAAEQALQPHQAAYSTIQFSYPGFAVNPRPLSLHAPTNLYFGRINTISGMPTGAVWRLKVNVSEKLTGLAGVSAGVANFPEMQARLRRAGITNAPINPFAGTYSYFGKATIVSSPEAPTP
jgi:hypothetical protein